jgi:hypothetical protein
MTAPTCPLTAVPASEPDLDADALDRAAEAIIAYLEEVHGYRDTCQRHELTAGVYATTNALHVVRIFHASAEVLANLRDAGNRLPAWRDSPWWDSDKERWRQLRKTSKDSSTTRSGGPPLFSRGVLWEGRPMLARTCWPGDGRLLRLDLILPAVELELPELPLRQVALGLRCHEFLLPARVAVALTPCTLPELRSLSPREYLQRAMPQNLYASQCFSLGGAAQ